MKGSRRGRGVRARERAEAIERLPRATPTRERRGRRHRKIETATAGGVNGREREWTSVVMISQHPSTTVDIGPSGYFSSGHERNAQAASVSTSVAHERRATTLGIRILPFPRRDSPSIVLLRTVRMYTFQAARVAPPPGRRGGDDNRDPVR